MEAKLYSLALSHPVRSVRAMLDHKGIAYRTIDLVPGLQPVVVRLAGFRGATVPALVLDGRKVQGSLAISRMLDEVRPDPPLFPSDPVARRRVEDAERWGEQVLQPVPRRIFRWMLAHDAGVRRWLAVDVSGVPGGALIARPSAQARLFARVVGADDATVRADIAALPALLDEVERLRREGVIGGAAPNAADFQIAPSVRLLTGFTDLAPLVGDHPAVAWAEGVVPALPGPTPPALPAAWLSRSAPGPATA